MKLNRIMIIVGILATGMAAQAQTYTWDVVPGTIGPGDNAIISGNGTWDTSTGNWTTDGGTNNVAWVNGSDAEILSTSTLDLASGVSVGGITLANGPVNLKSITDNNTLTVVGSPIWALKTRTLQFVNNQVNDTRLAMASGETLTVTGTTALLNTGEKPNDADWNVAGATLDFQANSGTLKGNKASVGNFSLVKMAGGSTYSVERNTIENYTNNWELGSGIVTFDNRYSRYFTLSGTVGGAGTLRVNDLSGYEIILRGNNTFTGGIIADAAISGSRFNITADSQLGAVPASADPANITLANGGELKMNGVTLDSNRGITLDNGGTIINTTAANTYGGTITGTGGLQIGTVADTSGNTLILTGHSDYSNGTEIVRGYIQLGVNDALPTNTVLSIGGAGTAKWNLEGFNQTLGGLQTAGIGTRSIANNGTASTVIIHTGGFNYDYAGNFEGTGDINLVKDGSGSQTFSKSAAYAKSPAAITINEGSVNWDSPAGSLGLITVNSNAVLGGRGQINEVDFQLGSGLHPGSPNQWIDNLEFMGDVDISGIAAANAGGLEFGFGSTSHDMVIATNGTLSIGNGELGFADIAFNDNTDGLSSGVYTLVVANVVSGTLDPADLSGVVGNKGATGTLSLSGGSLLVTVTAGDYSAFGAWALSFGLVGDDAAEDADPDMDGYGNLQEFAFGGNPTHSADAGYVPDYGTVSQGGTNWLIYGYAYNTNADCGVDYNFRTAPDLVYGPWTNANYTVLGTGLIAGTEFATTTNAIPMTDTKYFMSLLLEKQ